MAAATDVAEYILDKLGPMPAVKLQKLVFYAQAWSLVWDERPLFSARIEAWANGPVVPSLYRLHRGHFEVAPTMFKKTGSPSLSKRERETVDAVIEYYGGRSSQWLSELTHREAPWRDARQGLAPGERGSAEITHEAMANYYHGLI